MKRLGAPFWRMYAGSATSNLADGIGRAALPLLGASYTHDPLAISGLVTFAFLPWLLFALPSGAIVDRVDRRYAMAVANTVRALSAATLAVLVLTHSGTIVALYVVAFALGVAETVYDSAVRALLPKVVGREQLDSANSLLTVEETLGQLFLGAPLGSVLFASAVALPFVLNGIGFALAVLLIMTLRGAYRPKRAERTTVRQDISEGVRWLRAHDLLRGLTVNSAGTAFAQTMVTGVLVLYVLEVLRLPEADFGLMLLAAGCGGLIGGLATPPLSRRLGRARILTIGAVASALSFGLMALTRNGVVAAVLFAFSGAGVMVWNVLTMSLRQALIPEELFGRVQGAYRTLVFGAIPLGSLAGGVLADAIGIRWVVAISGAIMLALAVRLGLLLRRHADLLAHETDPAAVLVEVSA